MYSFINVCASLVLLGLSITSVSCLMCHVCSTTNPGQEDCMTIAEENSKYLTNCTAPKDQSCRIQEQWVDFVVLEQSHEKRTIRQCASTEFDPDRPCYYRTGFGGKVSVCNCIEDGCNEAGRTVPAIFITVSLFFLVNMFS